ncbi:MAG: hypothetical protein ACYDC6_10555, partial [Acidobacteriaceae bacterium]
SIGLQRSESIRHVNSYLYVYIRTELCHKKKETTKHHFYVAHPIEERRWPELQEILLRFLIDGASVD